MASNRSKAPQHDAATAALTDGRTPALTTIARRVARVQVASGSAAAVAFTGWATAAGRVAQTIGDELLQRIDGITDSDELAANVARAAKAHLGELTALPRDAVDHFDARLMYASTNTQEEG